MRWNLSGFSFLHDNANITLPAVAYVPFWRIDEFKEIMLNGHFARFLATNSGVTYVLTNDYAISAPKEACPDTASVRVDECATSPLIAKTPPILKTRGDCEITKRPPLSMLQRELRIQTLSSVI